MSLGDEQVWQSKFDRYQYLMSWFLFGTGLFQKEDMGHFRKFNHRKYKHLVGCCNI